MTRFERLTVTHEDSTRLTPRRAHERPTSAPATGTKARTRRAAAPGSPHTARTPRTPLVTRFEQRTASHADSIEPALHDGERPASDPATGTPPTALPTAPDSPAPHPPPAIRSEQLPIPHEDSTGPVPRGVCGRPANGPATNDPATGEPRTRLPAPHPHPEDPHQ